MYKLLTNHRSEENIKERLTAVSHSTVVSSENSGQGGQNTFSYILKEKVTVL